MATTDRAAARLCQLQGIAFRSASILVTEMFGWRTFHNRREVGALAGLVPTPYDSGESRREQGISKAGHKRVRRVIRREILKNSTAPRGADAHAY